jgi:NAD(P)H-dependent FMN reductase
VVAWQCCILLTCVIVDRLRFAARSASISLPCPRLRTLQKPLLRACPRRPGPYSWRFCAWVSLRSVNRSPTLATSAASLSSGVAGWTSAASRIWSRSASFSQARQAARSAWRSGLARAGWLGSLAAWIGFTMPSALALIAFAYGIAQYGELANSGAVHGLKVVAVAIVAQAVWGMAKALCPDRPRAGLAIVAALLPSAFGQVAIRQERKNRAVSRYWWEACARVGAAVATDIGFPDDRHRRSLSLYNDDLDADPPEAWQVLRRSIHDAHALLFITPEYNRSMPSPLKNAIDVGSRPKGASCWSAKPAAVISQSPREAGRVWRQSSPAPVSGGTGRVHNADARGVLKEYPRSRWAQSEIYWGPRDLQSQAPSRENHEALPRRRCAQRPGAVGENAPAAVRTHGEQVAHAFNPNPFAISKRTTMRKT